MKHTPLIAALVAAFGCLHIQSAHALALGEMSVQSALGEPFLGRVPVTLQQNEPFDGHCVSLSRGTSPESPFPFLTKARITVENTNNGRFLIIRGLQPVHDPFVKILVKVDCGASGELLREYTLLIDPPIDRPAVAPVARIPAPAPRPAATPRNTLEIQPGDTVRGIAQSVYPGNRAAQDRFVSALVALNPGRLHEGERTPLVAGATLAMPDLRSIARQAPDSATEPPKKAPASAPREKPVSQPHTGPAKTARSTPTPEPGRFELKLSSSDLDLSRVGALDETQRLELLERQMLLDADDQVAEILELQNRVKHLEAQLEGLRLQLSETLPQPSTKSETPSPAVLTTPDKTLAQASAWIGGAVALLAGLLLMWRARKRRQEEEEMLARVSEQFVLPREAATPLRPAATPAAPDDEPSGHEEPYYDPHSIFKPAEQDITLTEVDSVLEEADLYLIYGWKQKAIDLLTQHIERHPQDLQPYMMLFDIYRTEGHTVAFYDLAQTFKARFPTAEQWTKVAQQGRELDSAEPLYFQPDDEPPEQAQALRGDDMDTPTDPHSIDFTPRSEEQAAKDSDSAERPLPAIELRVREEEPKELLPDLWNDPPLPPSPSEGRRDLKH